jgi:hypothetical protein
MVGRCRQACARDRTGRRTCRRTTRRSFDLPSSVMALEHHASRRRLWRKVTACRGVLEPVPWQFETGPAALGKKGCATPLPGPGGALSELPLAHGTRHLRALCSGFQARPLSASAESHRPSVTMGERPPRAGAPPSRSWCARASLNFKLKAPPAQVVPVAGRIMIGMRLDSAPGPGLPCSRAD